MLAADPRFPLAELNALQLRLQGRVAVEEGPALAVAIRAFGQKLAATACPGSLQARLLADLNDALVGQLIAQTASVSRLPEVPWVWLALGSQGRREQSFSTDQDNGLLFSAVDEREAEAMRQRFVPFGERLNALLDACGFAFCSGGVMAGNPAWCLSLHEWQQCFADWIRKPEAVALLNATIFFDFRPLCGHAALADVLRQHLLTLTRDTPVFLHLMAGNALRAEVPLARMGDFQTFESGGRKVIDLKHCARIAVDAARIFALASGTEAVDTTSRLIESGPVIGLLPQETAAAADAFSHLLRLRLSAQAGRLQAGETPDHLLDPADLHELDRHVLKSALLQIRRLQQRLRLNYGL